MQLDPVALEGQPRGRHVQAPHPGGGHTDLGHALVPVRYQVGVPLLERQRVVLPQVLHVADLEADVLRLGDDLASPGQLPVWENVAIDERVALRLGSVIRHRDAVVEQPASRP